MENVEKVNWNQRYIDANTPWDSGIPSEELQRFVKSGIVKPGRALEIGCGTGTNAIFLAQNGFDVTGVDLSDAALQQARDKAAAAGTSIKFVEADVTKLALDEQPFPFVFDRGTYHIVRHNDLKGFQSVLSKFVAPGGYFLVLAGNANDNGPPEQGPPRVSASDLCHELECDSFDLVNLEEAHFHGIRVGGEELTPLSWKALFRRRSSPR